MNNSNLIEYLVKMNTDQAQTALKGFGGGMTSAIENLTGFNVGALATGGAVLALGGYIVNSTKQVMDYNLQMGKTSDLIGVNVEDYSRLVQAGDDLRISQDSITMAMKMAVQNGFQPSIANMAQLADKISGMTDQVEIANVLQPIFGRQWNEIYPLLNKGGQALRDNTAAINDNMVATQATVKASRELYANLDNLGDSWTGIANTVGNKVIPVVSAFLVKLDEGVKVIELLWSWNQKINEVWTTQQNVIAENSGTYAIYVGNVINAARESGKLGDAQYINIVQGRELKPLALEYMQGLGMLTPFEYEAARASAKMAAENDKNAMALSNVTQATHSWQVGLNAIPVDVDKYSKALYDARKASEDMIPSVGTAGQQFQYMAWKAADAKTQVDLAKQSLQTFGENLGGQVVSALEQAGVKGEKLALALGVIDEAAGTAYQWQENVKNSAQQLADEYARTGNLDAFQKKYEEVTQKLEGTNTKLSEQKQLLDDTKIKLDALTAHEWTVKINYQISGSVPEGVGGGGTGGSVPGSGHYDQSQGRDVGLAGGGSYVVPSGYYESWPVGPGVVASSGERVTVTPANQVTNNMGGVTIVVSGAGSPNAVAQAVALRLASYGKQYQGV